MLDIAMCALWILTYILVLIGTIKYRYPLISPITQAIIAPFEWSVLFLQFNKLGGISVNYVFIAYLFWAILEIAIFRAIVKTGYVKKHHVKPYIVMVILITMIMLYLVVLKQIMFFFSYFNTFLGMLIWVGFICKKNYPMKGISLAVFIVKFIADVLRAMVYWGKGSWLINVLSILLPILEFFFIPVWFVRRKISKRGDSLQRRVPYEPK